MIDITRAKAITGFMSELELTWLAEQAQTHRAIVEIGSYLGRSTRALGDHTEGMVLAIDDWKGPRHNHDCDKDQLLKRFYRNLKDLIEVGKVRYLVADHGEAKAPFRPDFVFVDGDHDYESVKRDILTWSERLLPGGLLAGHDFPGWPGVKQAVEELLPKAKFAPDTSIWFVEALA